MWKAVAILKVVRRQGQVVLFRHSKATPQQSLQHKVPPQHHVVELPPSHELAGLGGIPALPQRAGQQEVTRLHPGIRNYSIRPSLDHMTIPH